MFERVLEVLNRKKLPISNIEDDKHSQTLTNASDTLKADILSAIDDFISSQRDPIQGFDMEENVTEEIPSLQDYYNEFPWWSRPFIWRWSKMIQNKFELKEEEKKYFETALIAEVCIYNKIDAMTINFNYIALFIYLAKFNQRND